MVFVYQGVKVNFKLVGEGKKTTLLLHGWGCDGEIFSPLINHFENRRFVVLDFPPFGLSDPVNGEWNIYTYASMVMSLCQHLKLQKFDILAHSFGGRVAILIASLVPEQVENLVLVGSAGLRPKPSLKRFIKIREYKIKKRLGFNVERYGSADYKKLDDETKKVFVSIVSENLKNYCPRICAKTLIVFGERDKDTPVYMAKKLHKLIKNSSLVILKDAGHFAFLDAPLSFIRAVDKFWEET